ncbi:MAG: phytanoyl-CoA dioxygenase [Rhodospirillales bacterium]|nr:phytanoyl-CoA dioxygenase [Rhodospirillales bacterium]
MELKYFQKGSSVEDVKSYIDEWGFAVVAGASDDETMDSIAKDMNRYSRGMRPLEMEFFGGALIKVEGFVAKSSGMVELLNDPFLVDLSEEYLGADVLMNASGGFILENGKRPQPLHHDDVLYSPFLPRGGPESMVNFMFAVTDFTAENGATRMVPGSHKWPAGRLPGEEDEVVDIAMRKGSVAIWLGSTWHGAGQNKTDKQRLGAEIAFNCGWLRPHEAYHLLVPPALARDMPPQVQEVLGYKAHRGMLGCLEQRSPMELFGFSKPVPVRAVVAAGEERGHVDLYELEAWVKQYFLTENRPLSDEARRHLKRLGEINASRRGTTNRADLDMLEVVAEAQGRGLVGCLEAAGYTDAVEALRRVAA